MSNFEEFVLAPSDSMSAQRGCFPDRRKRARTTVHWPLLIFRNARTDGIETTTHNLSSTGFFCFSQTDLDVGESIICTFRIPAHDPEGKDKLWILECRASVKRVEPGLRDGLYGLACEFEDYRLLASKGPV